MVEGDDRRGTREPTAGGGKTGTGGATRRQADARRRRSAKPAVARAVVEPSRPAPLRIGVISDTHGYLDPVVAGLFSGVAHISTAATSATPPSWSRSRAIAPVTAVSGNVEGNETSALPREVTGEVAGVRFVVAHKPKRLLKRLAAGRVELGPGGALPDLVVFGHTHVPSASWVDGTLYLNPGTASSPDEEDDGPTVVIVEVEPTGLSARFIPLERRLDDDGSPLVTRAR